MEQTSGVLIVDKHCGITSHDVVAQVRKQLQTKVGHLGTLDPAATGVLPLVLGRATRLVRFMKDVDKEYLATIRLGTTTDSHDGDGRILRERTIPFLTWEEAEDVLQQFRGEVSQTPPMFSAVKVDGERLYKAARRGETRERPSRSVTIYELLLLDKRTDSWDIRVRCSSGTYIRSLAHDVGETLGCGAFLEQLRRTRSGSFDLSNAIPFGEVEENWRRALIPMDRLLPDLPTVNVDENEAQRIIHGNPHTHSEAIEVEYCRLFYRDLLLAIGRVNGRLIQPQVVLRTDLPSS